MKKKSFIQGKLSMMYLMILVLFLSVSCDFNNKFLNPLKLHESRDTVMVDTITDTLVVLINGENFQPLFTTNGKDPAELNYTIESVVFKSSNGNGLNGWLLKPVDMKANITLLHFHGNKGNLYYQYQLIAPIVDNGFQVFMFDYSGFGFSEGKATRDNAYEDAYSALDYIKSRPDIKDTKLVIYGQSFGGHLAAVVGSRRQKDIDAMVIEGAFSSYRDIAANSAAHHGEYH